ncbi:hypothetical protein AgCh_035119 [Apium graveolens]
MRCERGRQRNIIGKTYTDNIDSGILLFTPIEDRACAYFGCVDVEVLHFCASLDPANFFSIDAVGEEPVSVVYVGKHGEVTDNGDCGRLLLTPIVDRSGRASLTKSQCGRAASQSGRARYSSCYCNGRTSINESVDGFSQPKINDIQSSIVRPAIAANTFEIKPGIIQMVQNSVQFEGSPTEDPNMHIRDFIEICDTFKFNNVSEDAVKLRLFPFSLRDKAKSWLHSLPSGSITTWEDLAQKFLTKFFPMAKTVALRNALTQFAQQSGETLCEAWEHYKEMLRKCHHHDMPDWMIIDCFYNGLGAQSRLMLNVASGGALWANGCEEAYALIEMMVANEYQYPTQRFPQGKVAGVFEVDTATATTPQLKELSMKIDSLANYGVHQMTSVCALCAGSHVTEQCAISSESTQFVSNFQRSQQPMSYTYHPDNWNHHNFSLSNNQNAMQQPFQQFGNKQFNPPGFQQQFVPRKQFQLQQQTHGGACLSSNKKSELEELRLMCKNQSLWERTRKNSILLANGYTCV